jgi:hypothetical protein
VKWQIAQLPAYSQLLYRLANVNASNGRATSKTVRCTVVVPELRTVAGIVTRPPGVVCRVWSGPEVRFTLSAMATVEVVTSGAWSRAVSVTVTSPFWSTCAP